MIRHKAKIVIVPMGDVDYFQINKLTTVLSGRFGYNVDILQGIKPPEEAFDLIRGQYLSTIVLQKLEVLKASNKERVLGIIEDDIYNSNNHVLISDVDRVAGASILSMFHLKQQFYGLPDDDKRIYHRLIKEAIRAIGALFKMPFCRNPRCVMYVSTDMYDIDEKGEKFCDNCRRTYLKVM